MSLTKYTILHKEKILYKNLTEEEYFDIMEDLSIEYYQKGSPRPQDLKTKMIKVQEYYGSSFKGWFGQRRFYAG